MTTPSEAIKQDQQARSSAPLPFKVKAWKSCASICDVVDADGYTVVDFVSVPLGEQIVKACNSHDELVEALKVVREYVLLANEDLCREMDKDLSIIDAAIAKATGAQS